MPLPKGSRQAVSVMRLVDQAITMTRGTVSDSRPPALDQGFATAIVVDSVIAFSRKSR